MEAYMSSFATRHWTPRTTLSLPAQKRGLSLVTSLAGQVEDPSKRISFLCLAITKDSVRERVYLVPPRSSRPTPGSGSSMTCAGTRQELDTPTLLGMESACRFLAALSFRIRCGPALVR